MVAVEGSPVSYFFSFKLTCHLKRRKWTSIMKQTTCGGPFFSSYIDGSRIEYNTKAKIRFRCFLGTLETLSTQTDRISRSIFLSFFYFLIRITPQVFSNFNFYIFVFVFFFVFRCVCLFNVTRTFSAAQLKLLGWLLIFE